MVLNNSLMSGWRSVSQCVSLLPYFNFSLLRLFIADVLRLLYWWSFSLIIRLNKIIFWYRSSHSTNIFPYLYSIFYYRRYTSFFLYSMKVLSMRVFIIRCIFNPNFNFFSSISSSSSFFFVKFFFFLLSPLLFFLRPSFTGGILHPFFCIIL